MDAPSQIKELRGGVQVVRRTSNSADWPQRNRLCVSLGKHFTGQTRRLRKRAISGWKLI